MQTLVYVHGTLGSNSLLELFKNSEHSVFKRDTKGKPRKEWITYCHKDNNNYPGSLKLHVPTKEIPLLKVRIINIGTDPSKIIGAFISEMFSIVEVVNIQVFKTI